jgi:zinc transporter, ZIP family
VSSGNILILGAIAGLTIFFGLPVGRLKNPAPRLKAFLNATAIGVLVFLLWDVLTNGWQPIEDALSSAQSGKGTWPHFAGLAATFAFSLGAGLIGLVYYDRWMSSRAKAASTNAAAATNAATTTTPSAATTRAAAATNAATTTTPSAATTPPHGRFGPGAAAVDEFVNRESAQSAQLAQLAQAASSVRFRQSLVGSPAKRLAFFIALGIGLHNFAEGLAIGQSAAKGEVSLALLLIIGFGLHNATEGFGIVAPLAAESVRPSWGFLTVMGLIGGGPTFFGTLVGQSFVNNAVFIGFLALAAGSILYVVIQLLNVAQKMGHQELLMWGVLLGIFAGFATDLVLKAAGT